MGTAPAAYMGKPTAAVGLPGPVSAATNAADAGTAYGVPSDADRATGSPIYSAPVRSHQEIRRTLEFPGGVDM